MYPRGESLLIAELMMPSARALERPKEVMQASSSRSISGGGEDRARQNGGGGVEGGGEVSKTSAVRFNMRGGVEGSEGAEIALICLVKSVVIKGVTIVRMAASGSTTDLGELVSKLPD